MAYPQTPLPPVDTRRSLHARGWTDDQILRARRAGRLRSAVVGTYYAAGADTDLVDLTLASLTAHFGDDVVAVLGTAARMDAIPQPWPADQLVHVALPPGREQAQIPGVRLHTWKLCDAEVERGAVARTTVERTLADLMCTTDRLSAVAAVDSALHQQLITSTGVLELADRTRKRRGAARSRGWWKEVDGRAESPLESRIRIRATDGGYPPDDLQQEFVVRGRRYFADLTWSQPNGRTLIGEADGRAFHELPDALLNDRHRANDLVGLGDVDLVRFTWGDSIARHSVPDVLARFLGPPAR